MATARSIWTGTISFGLISIPVKLYTAVRQKGVSFNQLDDRDMSRVRYRRVSGSGDDDVPTEHIVKGVEVERDQYVVVDPEELAPFVPLATKQIDVEEFVELAEIDPVMFDATYYVAPATGKKSYALLARALQETGRVAIVRFVMRSRQYTAALRAVEGRLMLSTLAYADEIVSPADIGDLAELEGVELSEREVRMAGTLVESLAAPFEPEKYRDTYRQALLELIEAKATGQQLVAAGDGEPAKVVDMMEALEASVAAAREARKRHPTARTPKAGRSGGVERAARPKPASRSKSA